MRLTLLLRQRKKMPATTSRPLVIILENDRTMANALGLLVHDWGFAVISAPSAKEVVRALGPNVKNVRAIIADYHLDEGFTGIKGASAIAQAIGHKVPTIVTTGHAVQAEHEDVFPVLSKPFDPEVLHRWLDDHVGGAVSGLAA